MNNQVFTFVVGSILAMLFSATSAADPVGAAAEDVRTVMVPTGSQRTGIPVGPPPDANQSPIIILETERSWCLGEPNGFYACIYFGSTIDVVRNLLRKE